MTGIPLDEEGSVIGAADDDSLVEALATLADYVDDHYGDAPSELRASVASVLCETAMLLESAAPT